MCYTLVDNRAGMTILMATSTADLILKLVQIGFYLCAMLFTLLTYRSAKRGLLNTINTEYHRRVIDRLSEVSRELWREFELHPEGLVVELTAEICRRTRTPGAFPAGEAVALGYDAGSTPRFAVAQTLGKLYFSLIADPFVPRVIRDPTCAMLKHRIWATSVAAEKTLEFVGARQGADLERNVRQTLITLLSEAGYSPRAAREKMYRLRIMIQTYLLSFDPQR
jgi:hypothetical protein